MKHLLFRYINTNHKVSILRGSVSKRLADWKRQDKKLVTGPYQFELFSCDRCYPFYLDSDFSLGLRWDYVHNLSRSIKHTGYYIDQYCDETVKGIVARLPANRGYLAGYSYGESMISWYEREICLDEIEAINRADQLAEQYAEECRAFYDNEGAE